jgi:flagellar biosynthesis anti-sigma factor FlgM
MRVDLNHGAQSLPQTERSATENDPASSTSEASGSSQAPGVDQAQLSGAHTQVAALAAQAAQLPEVREERVQSLRQALLGGRYSTTATQVAGAMFDHLLAGAA